SSTSFCSSASPTSWKPKSPESRASTSGPGSASPGGGSGVGAWGSAGRAAASASRARAARRARFVASLSPLTIAAVPRGGAPSRGPAAIFAHGCEPVASSQERRGRPLRRGQRVAPEARGHEEEDGQDDEAGQIVGEAAALVVPQQEASDRR